MHVIKRTSMITMTTQKTDTNYPKPYKCIDGNDDNAEVKLGQ